MGRQVKESDRSYIPLEEATNPPTRGTWDVWVDCYWSHMPGKGLIIYRGHAPQCNAVEWIARRVGETHPGSEIIQIPYVYLRHRCQDYQ